MSFEYCEAPVFDPTPSHPEALVDPTPSPPWVIYKPCVINTLCVTDELTFQAFTSKRFDAQSFKIAISN